MQFNNRIINPVQHGAKVQPQAKSQLQNVVAGQAVNGSDFQQMMEGLRQSKQDVQFSKHANARLDARNIQLDGGQLERLSQGVAKAQGKGIRDGLVLIDNIALVVNITNKVVVTALNQQDQVFTNIDGAVIV
ncbi:MAG: hypothetical protein FWD97_04120 [Defluviitaleaceae bacterium]|nr:hypothetical protein [Defluviitaleaceae bacterium]